MGNEHRRGVPWVRWIFYIGVVGIGLALGWQWAAKRIDRSAQECLDDYKAGAAAHATAVSRSLAVLRCVEERNGLVARLQYRRDSALITQLLAPPPERYIGEWASTERGCIVRYVFRKKGDFVATPWSCADRTEARDGSWGVAGDRMVMLWRSGRAWLPEERKIATNTPAEFTLVDIAGTVSKFTRSFPLRKKDEWPGLEPQSLGGEDPQHLGVRTDGIYVSESHSDGRPYCSYLRFSDDGRVIGMATTVCDSTKQQGIFFGFSFDQKRHIIAKGHLVSVGRRLAFDLDSKENRVAYRGEVLDGNLRLESHASNGFREELSFSFVPIESFPKIIVSSRESSPYHVELVGRLPTGEVVTLKLDEDLNGVSERAPFRHCIYTHDEMACADSPDGEIVTRYRAENPAGRMMQAYYLFNEIYPKDKAGALGVELGPVTHYLLCEYGCTAEAPSMLVKAYIRILPPEGGSSPSPTQ